MNPFPLRVPPGADLRKAIEECLTAQGQVAGFVLSGIGSLNEARIRYAGQHQEAVTDDPLEILSLAGSVTQEGAHLHVAVANDAGEVRGGHLCYGSTIRTTAEILIAFLPTWHLTRSYDPVTGYRELVVVPRASGVDAFAARALGAVAFGAVATGAFAVGAMAVGALAVGRLAIGRARIRRLEIDELVVKARSSRERRQ